MDNMAVAIISGGSAILGGLMTGVLSIIASIVRSNREDRRHQEEIQRSTASERINKLYVPLMAIMAKDPEDGFYLESEEIERILNKIDKEEMCASPQLLKLRWELEYLYRFDIDKIADGLDWKIYSRVASELAALKAIIGYGTIIKEDSWLKKVRIKIANKSMDYYRQVRRKIFVWKVKIGKG